MKPGYTIRHNLPDDYLGIGDEDCHIAAQINFPCIDRVLITYYQDGHWSESGSRMLNEQDLVAVFKIKPKFFNGRPPHFFLGSP